MARIGIGYHGHKERGIRQFLSAFHCSKNPVEVGIRANEIGNIYGERGERGTAYLEDDVRGQGALPSFFVLFAGNKSG